MSDDGRDEPGTLFRRRVRAAPLRVPIEHVARVSAVDHAGWSEPPRHYPSVPPPPPGDTDELEDIGSPAPFAGSGENGDEPTDRVPTIPDIDDDDSAEISIGPATGEFDALDDTEAADRLAASFVAPSEAEPATTSTLAAEYATPAFDAGEAEAMIESVAEAESALPAEEFAPLALSGELPLDDDEPPATAYEPAPMQAMHDAAPTPHEDESDEDVELEEMSEQELAVHGRVSLPKAPPAPPAKAPPAPPAETKAPVVPRAAEARTPPPAPVAGKAPPAPPKPPAEAPIAKKRPRVWYEDFFSDDYLRTVRQPTERQIARECDFIEKTLGLAAGATILDVGCGLGLHAIEMSKRGYLVVGLDLSLPMLSRASEDAKDQGLRINFLHGDMREMSFEGAFDCVLSWGTSFGYFDDETNKKVLSRFYASLKPGGQLLLDVSNRDYVVGSQPNLVWFEGDGCICMEETRINYLSSRLEVTRNVMLDDGTQRDRSYSIRLYALHELGQMLHQARFRVLQVSGLTATPGVFFGADSARILVLAERKREDEGRSTPPTSSTSEGPTTGAMEPLAPATGRTSIAPPPPPPPPTPSNEG